MNKHDEKGIMDSIEYGGYRVYMATLEINNIKKAIDYILQYEQEGIWIQLIPCEIVVSKEQILHAVYSAIDAFNGKTNISRKINLEILLRILGRRQIREVISVFNSYAKERYWAIIVIDNKNKGYMNNDKLNKILRELGNLIQSKNCEWIKNLVFKVYGLSQELISLQKDVREDDSRKIILMSILETISIKLVD